MSRKVIVLVGSGTVGSRSLELGRKITAALESRGLELELINLLELQLPPYDATTEVQKTYTAKTQDFLDKSYAADGWVWVTPVYHNSYSSILKTALDWQHKLFDGKVLGLACHSERSTTAIDQLLMVARAQHFVTIPTRVATENQDYDDQKQLVNQDIKVRIERFANEFVTFLDKFAA